MVYLAPPRKWVWWFGFRWFVDPSGGHAPPWTLWQRLTEGPLLGHSFGSWLAALAGWSVFGLHGWRLWGFVLLAHFAWQAFNVERRAYSPETAVGQVLWRVLIGAVAGLPVVCLA